MPPSNSTRFRDLTGQKFGKWLVLARGNPRPNSSAVIWLCRCDCGTERGITTYELTSGHTRRCRKCKGIASRSFRVGDRVGQWVIIDYRRRDGKHMSDYLCRCDCGKTRWVTAAPLSHGETKRCDDCRRDAIGRGRVSFWTKVLRGAASRGIPVNITAEYAFGLLKQQGNRCALTGVEIAVRYRSLTTASLDRIDSKRGYELDNIQWIHKDLNWMKRDLPQSRFIEWCRRVVRHADGRSKKPATADPHPLLF